MEKENIKQKAEFEFQVRGPPMSLKINELQGLCKKLHHHCICVIPVARTPIIKIPEGK